MQRFLEAVIHCLALWGAMGIRFLQRSREKGGHLLQLKRLIRGEESLAGMLQRVPAHPGQFFRLMKSHRIMLTSRIVIADDPSDQIPTPVSAACRRIHSVRDAWPL